MELSTKNMDNLFIRELNLKDIEELIKCLNDAQEQLNVKSLFAAPSERYLKHIISGAGVSFGIIHNNRIIGFASFINTKEAKTSLYSFSKLNINKDSVIQYEHGVITPEFQGNRLLQYILKYAKKHFRSLGYTHLISTVHPCNLPSMITAFNIGQYAVNIKQIYNHTARYIMVGQLLKTTNQFQNTTMINYKNLADIKALLRKDMVVFDYNKSSESVLIGEKNENQ